MQTSPWRFCIYFCVFLQPPINTHLLYTQIKGCVFCIFCSFCWSRLLCSCLPINTYSGSFQYVCTFKIPLTYMYHLHGSWYILFYRARVGLFYCICIRTKQNLSLNDIICINIMLQNGTSSLPSALLIQMFYGINTHRNISVVMKPSPYNVKSHSNACIFSTQHSVSVCFTFIAMLCLLYTSYIEYIVWGYWN